MDNPEYFVAVAKQRLADAVQAELDRLTEDRRVLMEALQAMYDAFWGTSEGQCAAQQDAANEMARAALEKVSK